MANIGKDFENQIRDSIKKIDDKIYYYRIPDPPQSFNINSDNNLRFSNKNPYDFIMYKNPFLYTIENKSKKEKRLSFSLDKKVKNVDLKYHQIMGLWDSYLNGAISGILINFNELDETYFLHIWDFLQFAKTATKKSVNKDDIIKCGAMLIPQQKKVTKFTYDIKYLMQECESKYDYYLEMIPNVTNV